MAKILVVDDEKGIRDILNLALSKEGHEVHIANDGKDALEKVYDLSPDLMILDVMMPELNGYEVCEEIRKSDSHRELPILMISGINEPEHELKAFKTGADGFLAKPFDTSVLLKRIKRLFRYNKHRKSP